MLTHPYKTFLHHLKPNRCVDGMSFFSGIYWYTKSHVSLVPCRWELWGLWALYTLWRIRWPSTTLSMGEDCKASVLRILESVLGSPETQKHSLISNLSRFFFLTYHKQTGRGREYTTQAGAMGTKVRFVFLSSGWMFNVWHKRLPEKG